MFETILLDVGKNKVLVDRSWTIGLRVETKNLIKRHCMADSTE